MKHLDFILLDIICLELSLFLAHQIRHGFRSMYALSEYEKMGVVLLLLDLCVVFFRDSYNQVIKRGYLKEFVDLGTGVRIDICGALYVKDLVEKTNDDKREVKNSACGWNRSCHW